MGMRCPPITTNGQTAGRIFQNKILSRSTNKSWDHSTWAPYDVAHASCCRNWSADAIQRYNVHYSRSLGGSDPWRLLGGTFAQKRGALPPDFVFFPRRLFLLRLAYLPRPKEIARAAD